MQISTQAFAKSVSTAKTFFCFENTELIIQETNKKPQN